MADFPVPKQPYLVPMNESELTAPIERYVRAPGMPFSIARLSTVFRRRASDRELVRTVIELMNDGPRFDYAEERRIVSKGLEFSVESRGLELSSYDATPVLVRVEKAAPDFYRDFVATGRCWYTAPIVWPRHSGPGYYIDSKHRWPSWAIVGTAKPFDWEKQRPIEWRQGGDAQEVEENLLGVHRLNYEELFPSAIIRLRQDLIQIETNRIIEIDGDDAIFLSFSRGLGSGVYVRRNAVTVRFQFRDRDGAIIAEGRNPVNDDEGTSYHSTVLRLNPGSRGRGARIFDVDIELYLNDVLVDWSHGHYMRSITVGS